MQTGDVIGRYTLGPQIGQGAFGNIFTARDNETGLIYAVKNESSSSERKSLKFEYKILRRIQGINYFPKLFDYGETKNMSYCVIELIGPSLSSIIKNLPERKFSLSTGIRTSKYVLHAIQSLHVLGFIHRDIKPANILVRIQHSPPICLIDFGLVRIYRDQKTGKHEAQRMKSGFRGTKTYASFNAHIQNDLSRRDDMISWFYFMLDIMTPGLPWKSIPSAVDVAIMKNEFNVSEFVSENLSAAPELVKIWNIITPLKFEEEPPYSAIEELLNEIIANNNIKHTDPWDWKDFVNAYRNKLTADFGVALRIDGGAEAIPYYTELGVPPQVFQQFGSKNSYNSITSPLVRKRQYSTMQLSELDERDPGCCC
jgi:serine/threonine protein kinase